MQAQTIRYEMNSEKFSKIPKEPIAYWLSDNFIKLFSLKKIGEYATSDGQTKTGNNDKYLRFIWEVNNDNTGKGHKWVFHVKGGLYRKWYGNIDTFIDWSEQARKHYKEDLVARIAPEYIWFREGLCWNLITSSEKFAVRLLTNDSTFNLAAPSIFFNSQEMNYYVLGLLNTIVAEKIIRTLNPTLNTNIGDILSQPLLYGSDELTQIVIANVGDNVKVCKQDWDSFETSWDFKKHPLV